MNRAHRTQPQQRLGTSPQGLMLEALLAEQQRVGTRWPSPI